MKLAVSARDLGETSIEADSASLGAAIARALIADPTILICDEPTGDLDRHTAEEILGLLQTLNRQYGKTIIMVTHDPKAASYASRQLQVDKGQLVDGAAKAVA